MIIGHEVLLTLIQSLQMVALAPCVLVILFLIFTTKKPSLIIVPCLYFLVLALSFLSLLIPAFYKWEDNSLYNAILFSMEFLLPSFSYLLIIQFIFNKIPKPIYWLILAVPFIGGAPFIYSITHLEQVCIDIDICFSAEQILLFNKVISSLFVFLLLTLIIGRKHLELDKNLVLRNHKYSLIISLIVFNVLLLSIDLGQVANLFIYENYLFSRTLIKITFVYLVLTSVFRVFTEAFDTSNLKLSYHKRPMSSEDMKMLNQMKKLLEQDKIYRELEFSRAYLAEKLGIKEFQLSKIVNMQYQKSIAELANDYRIADAKEMLINTDLSITAVSFDVGFNSITSFNRVFKEYTGISPSQFREEEKK